MAPLGGKVPCSFALAVISAHPEGYFDKSPSTIVLFKDENRPAPSENAASTDAHGGKRVKRRRASKQQPTQTSHRKRMIGFFQSILQSGLGSFTQACCLMLNVPARRSRATGTRYETERSSRVSVWPVCSASPSWVLFKLGAAFGPGVQKPPQKPCFFVTDGPGEIQRVLIGRVLSEIVGSGRHKVQQPVEVVRRLGRGKRPQIALDLTVFELGAHGVMPNERAQARRANGV